MFSHDFHNLQSRLTERMVIWDETLQNVLKSPWQYFCGWRQNSNFLAGFLFSHDTRRAGSELARARAASQASYPGLTRNLNRHLKTGSGRRPCALHSILSTGRLDSHGPGWDSQSINRDNHGSSRKSSLSISCWPSTINVHNVKNGYRSSSPVKTPMVSLFWCFSGPGCYWIISGYCVRVGLLK